MCALAVDGPRQAAAQCDARAPSCTGFGMMAAAFAPAPGNQQGAERTAILKSLSGTVAPRQLTYSPLSALFFKEGAAQPPRLPADPATADGGPPAPLPGGRSLTLNVLMRGDAELRALPDGSERWGGGGHLC